MYYYTEHTLSWQAFNMAYQMLYMYADVRTLWLLSILLVLHNITATDVNDTDDADTTIPETVIKVSDDQPHDFSSPNFPKCCQAVKYLLEKGRKGDERHWKILFTDLDLPPTSQLLIYGVKEPGAKKVPVDAARYFQGAWIRPVVLYEGYAVSIEFYPAQNSLKKSKENEVKKSTMTYVGFKGTYWLDQDVWELDKPFTFCPPIDDAIQGGKVNVTTINVPFDSQHYRIYCVWQFKPVPDSDLQIYITIEDMGGSDSMVKVHHGLTSSSPMVFSSYRVHTTRTFTSKDGFYIELSKAADGGVFTMSYGVYKALLGDEKCVFEVGGTLIEGFKCEEDEQDLCIPVENKCDSITDCPSGDDEMPRICEVPTTTTVMTTTIYQPTTIYYDCPRGRCLDGQCPRSLKEKCPEKSCGFMHRRCPGTLLCVMDYYENCPGEPCSKYQQTCADGSCVPAYSSLCRDGSMSCDRFEKRCKNGKCVKKYRRCPEDPCPPHQSYRCKDGSCLYQTQACDGYSQCSNGEDEHGCPAEKESDSSTASEYSIGWMWTLSAIPFGCCALCCYRLCITPDKNLTTTEEQVPMNPPAPQPTANARNDSSVAPTVIYNDSSGYGRPQAPSYPVYPSNISVAPSSGPPSGPPSFPSYPPLPPTPSAPPSYSDVVGNQDSYFPPPDALPSYEAATNTITTTTE